MDSFLLYLRNSDRRTRKNSRLRSDNGASCFNPGVSPQFTVKTILEHQKSTLVTHQKHHQHKVSALFQITIAIPEGRKTLAHADPPGTVYKSAENLNTTCTTLDKASLVYCSLFILSC